MFVCNIHFERHSNTTVQREDLPITLGCADSVETVDRLF